MAIQILLLIVGFSLLILGAHLLVDASVSLAKRFGVSELAIGLTIVAFGTSAPELVVNIVASVHRYNEIVLANIIGSNIFNLLLILGVSGMIYPISVKEKTVWLEIPFSVFATLLLLLLANTFFISDHKYLSRTDGMVMLLFFIAFMIYIFRNLKDTQTKALFEPAKFSLLVSIIFIFAGLSGLFFGGKMVVSKSIFIARQLMISEKLVGLTIVSIGTSLPELATSAVAAFKKKSDLAIGNVIGSNIFNILLILGISSLIHPVEYINSFNYDLIILILSASLLFSAMFTLTRKKLDRIEAVVLFVAFILYFIYTIKRN